jgi:hypothetical protein
MSDPLDLDTLNLIILLIKEFYEANGRWLTAKELRALMLKPS